jgi:hypothetical protein
MLRQNTLGSKMYPTGTNHFDPRSMLFKDHEREFSCLLSFWSYFTCFAIGWSIFLSDVGIGCMVAVLGYFVNHYGWLSVFMYYGIPYLVRGFKIMTMHL